MYTFASNEMASNNGVTILFRFKDHGNLSEYNKDGINLDDSSMNYKL